MDDLNKETKEFVKKKIVYKLVIFVIIILIGIVLGVIFSKDDKSIEEVETEFEYVPEQIVFETEINGEEVKAEDITNTENFIKVHEGGKYYKLNFSQNIVSVSLIECATSKNQVSYELKAVKASPKIIDNTLYMQYTIPDSGAEMVLQAVTDKDEKVNFLITKDSSGNIAFTEYEFNPGNVTLSEMRELYEDVTYNFDITGDGIEDEIIYKSNYSLIDEVTKPVLVVNGVEYKDMFKDYSNAMSSYFVVNLGYYSNYTELIFVNKSEEEFDKCMIMGYDGVEMKVIADNIYGTPGLSLFVENGELIAQKKTGVLGTEFIQTTYTYEQHQFLEKGNENVIEEETDKTIKTLQAILVYTECDIESENIVLDKYSIFTSNKSNGANWINVILEDGREYWYYIDEKINLDEYFAVNEEIENVVENTDEILDVFTENENN